MKKCETDFKVFAQNELKIVCPKHVDNYAFL